MKGCKCILIMALFVFTIMSYGQKEFKLSNNVPIDSLALQMSFNETSVCRPFLRSGAITGLAVSGKFQKTSPEYLVRIILKDTEGLEHLVMESYEEINDEDTVLFSGYCEETALLNHVTPDSLKIILKDATLQLDNLLTTKTINREVTSIESEHKAISKVQASNKIERINNYNKSHKRLWVAGETKLSKIDYSSRMNLLGFREDESSGGIEYYLGGIFEWGHSFSRPQSRETGGYVDSWDWRERHGSNWITPQEDQDATNFCLVFAGTGCLEAMTNLYYNRHLDINLSEQEVADCADNYPHPPADGFSLYTVLSYLCNSGVCDEVAYPKDFCYEPHPLIECKSGSIIPNELVSAHGYSLYSSNINQVKQALISNGPLISGWHKSQVGGHGMVLVGYRTIHEGDSIYYYNPHLNQVSLIDTIGENNPIVGATYWIFKNSYGDHPNGGYYHILFPEITENGLTRLEGLSLPASFQIPISTLKYTDNDIAIVDEDGDGYYNWGIGPKPASCPLWIPDTSDGDDSDPTKHLMDSYGNYPETYSFPMGTEYLNTNRTISGNESLMKDIDISHGTTLTITGSAYCLENVKINNYGGTLIIDGGVLANADIVLHSPCTFIIRNGGTVYMKKNKNLVIPVGCVSDIEGGEIRGPFERK